MKGRQGKRKRPNLRMQEAEAVKHRDDLLNEIRELAEKMNELAGIKQPRYNTFFDKPFSYCCMKHKKAWDRINGGKR